MSKNGLTTEQKGFIVEMAPILNDTKLTEDLNAKFQTNYKRSTISYVRRNLGIHKVRGRGVCRIKEETVANSNEPALEVAGHRI